MNFRSDNEAPVNSTIMQAIIDANTGFEESYGYDSFSEKLTDVMQQLFGCWCEVIPLTTGTAANALSVALTTPCYGSVFCSSNAHLINDECGAPEFYAGGAKLIGVGGKDGKVDLPKLDGMLSATGVHGEHECKPHLISITQSSEAGTIYSEEELKNLQKIKQKHGLYLHMDGSRIANAVVASGGGIADMTWKRGVDLLSFGATKNGAMIAEALVIFNPKIGTQIKRRRKQAGHLISKMRFVSAQLLAYLADDLWLKLAQHANDCAQYLYHSLKDTHDFLYPVQANEAFLRLSEKKIAQLQGKGFAFHVWPGSTDIIRLVFSHATKMTDVEQLIGDLSQIPIVKIRS